MAKPMNTMFLVAGAAVLVVLILIATIWGSYNNLVRLGQETDKTFADIDAQQQRRFDLVPNLVSTVSGYANFEKSTLTEITQLRSQWQTASTAEEKIQTANQFESTLSKLLLITENYPDLKANTNFIALQDSLTETENMISVTRTRYNAAVRDYNNAVRVFPSNIVAGWFGFSERSYFNAAPGAGEPPVVNFPS